jgi:hypothetical protein
MFYLIYIRNQKSIKIFMFLISQNLVEKASQLTLLSREVKLCVVREGLGQVQLDVLVGVQGIISLGFLGKNIFFCNDFNN